MTRTRAQTVAAAEARVARERLLLESEFAEWRAHTLGVLASPRGLGAALAAGFIAGGLIRRRRPKPVEGAPVKKGIAAVLAGLALSALRWRYGNPWAAVPEVIGWARSRGLYDRPAPRSPSR